MKSYLGNFGYWRKCSYNSVCPEGRYGNGCTEQCRCENGAHCHPQNGFCTCMEGYVGQYCDRGMWITNSRTCTTLVNCFGTWHIISKEWLIQVLYGRTIQWHTHQKRNLRINISSRSSTNISFCNIW